MTKAWRRGADGGTHMRRAMTLTLLASGALTTMSGGVPAPAAHAAPAAAAEKSAAKKPAIKLVAPMRVTVGRKIVVRGLRFSANRRRNTVIFIAPSKRSAFAKPLRAFPRKLVVRVPGSVERLLDNSDAKGVGTPTRFRLRVVAKRRYGKVSARRNSPVILSALRTGAPATCGTGDDFDRDLVSNSREALYKTDPCSADTDGDGVEDGFEQESALDLNQRAVPYPGKRPFPNALDPGDAGHDYDGDGLTNLEEFRAWAHAAASPPPSTLQFYTGDLRAPAFGGPYGDRPRFGNHTLPLSYSDGDQNSVNVVAGDEEYKGYLDLDADGSLTDDERDADGDGLGNFSELRGVMRIGYYPTAEGCGYTYEPVLPRPFLEPDYLDWDSDGDGIWDGNDDQDNDDVANADEIGAEYMGPSHPQYEACEAEERTQLPVNNSSDGSATLRHPYNPCLPYRSRTCNRYVPAG